MRIFVCPRPCTTDDQLVSQSVRPSVLAFSLAGTHNQIWVVVKITAFLFVRGGFLCRKDGSVCVKRYTRVFILRFCLNLVSQSSFVYILNMVCVMYTPELLVQTSHSRLRLL